MELSVHLKRPHAKQRAFIESAAKRKIIRAGRRGGKTTGIAILAVQSFLAGQRVGYTAPTEKQMSRFWEEVKAALYEPLKAGVFSKNETMHIIKIDGTEQAIWAKTAWNADSMRGDYADLLIFDEYQLTNEDAWGEVGAPMLADNDGDAVFIYTPPSLHSRSASKANDPRHAAKLFKRAQGDPDWDTFHFSSYDNPHISHTALDRIKNDMSDVAFRQEILAEDIDEDPLALWKRATLKACRVRNAPDMTRIAIGVDPPGGATECGIVAVGLGADGHGYVLEDASVKASPDQWASRVVSVYNRLDADRIFVETNFGGDMAISTIRTVDDRVRIEPVRASRGKAVRADPVSAKYEQGRVHHVGEFHALEDELCTWAPDTGMSSPNRLDALVWAVSGLILGPGRVGRMQSDGVLF